MRPTSNAAIFAETRVNPKLISSGLAFKHAPVGGIATTDFYNGDFNGSVNSAFAKLALSAVSGCYVPVKKFKRVLPHAVEKVGRLKFKFRYHNGIPVDFKHQAFDFSLKFECRFN